MNKPMKAPKMIAGVSLIPESAPFNEEQRAWLSGFFAGMTGIEELTAAGSGGASTLDVGVAAAEEEEEDFPWHDDALGIDERMELAADRPQDRKLMAAMAQLDCGSCGYLCQTYAEAINTGAESNLTLCTPGGKETAKMLKKLVKLGGEIPAGGVAATAAVEEGYTRKNPFAAKLIKSEKLTGEASNKDVRHVEIDLSGSGIHYEVGDALGLYATNCTELVDQLLGHCDDVEARHADSMSTRDLSAVTDELVELFQANVAATAEVQRLEKLVEDDDQIDELDVLDFLQMFSETRVSADAIMEALPELNPRLYSIASSLKAHPDQVHLTVGKVTYQKNERLRKGVASTFLADRVQEGGSVNVFVQKSHGFTIPADDSSPMIMVGPGTGIAPFLSFLQERSVRKASGDNWLFFGDQQAATDFLYQEQLEKWHREGLLNKLDTAFSRDQEEKIYVQDRMRENGAQLFQWLEAGGSFFVCGDASRMAKDVDKALHEIVQQQGALSVDDAKAYVKKLKAENRYCRDVY